MGRGGVSRLDGCGCCVSVNRWRSMQTDEAENATKQTATWLLA